jgi:hypothetical protein
MSQLFYNLVEIITGNNEVAKESLDDKLITQITLTLSNQVKFYLNYVILSILSLDFKYFRLIHCLL